MKFKISLLGAMLLTSLFSCEDDKPEPKPEEESSCLYGMQGVFSTDAPVWSADTVSILPYVTGGVFRMHSGPYAAPYWTTMQLERNSDTCYLSKASADTLNFTVRLKNPSTGAGALASYDMSLHLYGQNKIATVSFIGNAAHVGYTHLKVGTEGVTGVPELVRIFEDWTEVSLRTNGTSCTVYVNGVLAKSMNYTGAIGRLKDVRVTFKGYGSIDYFRVTGLQGAKIVRNEFNNVNTPSQGLEFGW
ncbi:hypothetical protein [Chitinophaga sp. YIM B06452]|uniref:hypothetical protein n=1 Tax=Chitinophaga sp. YIM B06452 TaxID=3082158 RepID=UPI0031FF0BA2